MALFSNSNSKMESRDHFKNGASPKSQMSRRNIKQKAFFLFTVLCNSISITLAQDANVQNTNSNGGIIFIIVLLVLSLAPMIIIRLIRGDNDKIKGRKKLMANGGWEKDPDGNWHKIPQNTGGGSSKNNGCCCSDDCVNCGICSFLGGSCCCDCLTCC